ncbi:MAG TPA: tetratricopeptide repeat protein [Bacteroidota bacterium]|nr:tetratricopeptide repeat protein [Bacteroidota bacterium]
MKQAKLLLGAVLLAQLAQAQDPFEKAKSSLAVRDTAGAISQFKEAIKAGRKVPESNFYLGSIAYARHHLDEALTYLQASVDKDGENSQAYKTLGDVLTDKKDPAGALAAYRKAIKAAPKDVSIAGGYGMALLLADSVDAAIVQLSRAKENTPDNPALYVALSEAYLKQNVYVLAISNLQKAIELEPTKIPNRLRLARIYFKNKQYVEAVKEYDGVIGIDSTFAEAYLEKGRIYFLAKQYKNAVPPLHKLISLQPGSVDGNALYARSLFGADEFPDAAKAAETSLKLDSSNVDVWAVEGQAKTKTKDWAGALVAFEALKRRKALKPEHFGDYGAALVGVGRDDEAITALQDAIKNDSTNCDTYFPLGFIFMKRQDYEHAAAMFEKKITCDKRSLSAYVNAAACYMQMKNWQRTRELLFKSIELKSDFLQGRLWLGRYYAQVDSLEKAVEQYDEVIKIIAANPENHNKEAGEAHMQKAQLYFIDKQYERSAAECRKVQEVGTETGGLHLMWGQALLQLLDPKGDEAENTRKKDESIAHLRRACALEPGNGQAHFWLAQALILSRKEGDDAKNKMIVEEACAELTKAMRIDPKNEDARKSKERIGCK